MSEINVYVGAQIRKYRKACKLTIQELADAIHKSRATVCKYENGTISIDIETLYEISQVLQVSFSQLSSYLPTVEEKDTIEAPFGRKSPFFQAKRLYFYFYDGKMASSTSLSGRSSQELMRQPCPSVLSPETEEAVRSSILDVSFTVIC